MGVKNSSGKPFDDLDAAKLRFNLFAQRLVGENDTYTIYSECGKPLTGFVAYKPESQKIFAVVGWTR
jgi:hypothetical protein